MLVLSATFPLVPTDPHVWPAWTYTVSSQHMIFFVSLYMVAIGYGGQCPCVASFGADQFDDTDDEERFKRNSFFNWQHFAINAGALISGTIIVWVQDHEGWLWGFAIPALFLIFGVGSFILALVCTDFRNLEVALLQECVKLLLRLLATLIRTCQAIVHFFMRLQGKVQQLKEAGNWCIQLDLSNILFCSEFF